MRTVGAMILVGLATLALPLAVAAAQSGPRVTAELRDAHGRVVGTSTFQQVGGGVLVRVEATDLPPGRHGVHVHEGLMCTPPDFASAGGHFNPTNRQHGAHNPLGSHAGDLPNLDVGPDRHGVLETLNPAVTLGPGVNSLLRPAGTSLVIHAAADDEQTDPAGNSGARIACGRISPALPAAPAPVTQLPRAGDLAPTAALLGLAAALAGAGGWLRRR